MPRIALDTGTFWQTAESVRSPADLVRIRHVVQANLARLLGLLAGGSGGGGFTGAFCIVQG